MNLCAWKIEKKEKKKVGGEMSCCYGFNRSTRYGASLTRHQEGERPLYRSKEEREEAWRRKGGKDDKATWFRKA